MEVKDGGDDFWQMKKNGGGLDRIKIARAQSIDQSERNARHTHTSESSERKWNKKSEKI